MHTHSDSISSSIRPTIILLLVIIAWGGMQQNLAYATVVRFNSVFGSFDVRMFDTTTPLTVANMLNYVNDGDFNDSIVHRVENRYYHLPDGSFVNDPFVIQGGDWSFPAGGALTQIPSDPPVTNEPGISNLRGTMALARQAGGVNSGTNNWFVNLGDNSFLDTVDEGFTVFGRVVNEGMQVVDAIANLPTTTIRNQFNQILGTTFPLHGDLSAGLTRENFVLFSSVEELAIPDGDYDFDGDVDGNDFLIWQKSLGSTVDVAADGNGNGVVDMADYSIWASGVSPAVLASTVAIPEPATISLTLFAALAALGRRRRCAS